MFAVGHANRALDPSIYIYTYIYIYIDVYIPSYLWLKTPASRGEASSHSGSNLFFAICCSHLLFRFSQPWQLSYDLLCDPAVTRMAMFVCIHSILADLLLRLLQMINHFALIPCMKRHSACIDEEFYDVFEPQVVTIRLAELLPFRSPVQIRLAELLPARPSLDNVDALQALVDAQNSTIATIMQELGSIKAHYSDGGPCSGVLDAPGPQDLCSDLSSVKRDVGLLAASLRSEVERSVSLRMPPQLDAVRSEMKSMAQASAAEVLGDVKELFLEKDAETWKTLTSTTRSLAESIVESTSTFSKKLIRKFETDICNINLQLQAWQASAQCIDGNGQNLDSPDSIPCDPCVGPDDQFVADTHGTDWPSCGLAFRVLATLSGCMV